MAVDLNRRIINITTYCDELEKSISTPIENNKISNDCATIASQNKFIAELQEQLANANTRSVTVNNNKISDDCATINELMKQINAPKIDSDCNTIKELMKQLNELKQQQQQQQPVVEEVTSREVVIENPIEVSKIENDCATIARQNKELLL
jgi:vacuolar-type H+-ATPase subunit I/STV1